MIQCGVISKSVGNGYGVDIAGLRMGRKVLGFHKFRLGSGRGATNIQGEEETEDGDHIRIPYLQATTARPRIPSMPRPDGSHTSWGFAVSTIDGALFTQDGLFNGCYICLFLHSQRNHSAGTSRE